MSIKFINRTPRTTDFKQKEIVIDGKQGNLFFKTHKNELKTLNPSDIILVSSSFSTVSGSYSTVSASFSAVSSSYANSDAGTHYTVIPFNYTIEDPTKTNDSFFIPFGKGVALETVGLFNSYFPAFNGTLHDMKIIAYSADTSAANDLGTNAKFQITAWEDSTDLSSNATAHTASGISDVATNFSILYTSFTATGIAGKQLHTFDFTDKALQKNRQLVIRVKGSNISENDVLYVAGTIRMSFDYTS